MILRNCRSQFDHKISGEVIKVWGKKTVMPNFIIGRFHQTTIKVIVDEVREGKL
jgi:hypothetical protein